MHLGSTFLSRLRLMLVRVHLVWTLLGMIHFFFRSSFSKFRGTREPLKKPRPVPFSSVLFRSVQFRSVQPPGRHRNRHLNSTSVALLAPLRSVQFSSDAKGVQGVKGQACHDQPQANCSASSVQLSLPGPRAAL